MRDLNAIRGYFKDFDEKCDTLVVSMVFYTPELITKKGTINKNSLDIDNIHKNISDLIFACQGKIDDSAITELNIKKLYGPEFKIVLTYNIVKRNESPARLLQ